MRNIDYPTKSSVLEHAQKLVDAKIPFGSLDISHRLSKKNKGDLGQIIEEAWFGYRPNSEKEPDFVESGVELKVSPYKITRNGISAKERLVCNIINYMEEVDKTFETSSFWHKCKCILLLSYLWQNDIDKEDMFIDNAAIIDGFPFEDILIIKQDWEIIIQKIRAGKAHLLTEGDTRYLAACTKGSSADSSFKQQPFNDIKAKQRAYSLKTTYMTRILRKYIFGEDDDEHIIKDYHLLETTYFDDIVLRMFKPYIGLSTYELSKKFGMTWETSVIKNINSTIAQTIISKRILEINGDPNEAEEFKNANISVKTIVVNKENMPEQSMSFPTFEFLDIIEQEWEDSDVYEQMVASRFLFVIFERENKASIPILREVFFWNMPAKDIPELQHVWEKTRKIISDGVELELRGEKVYNNLPKESQSYLAHVRPKSGKAAYHLYDGTIIGDPEKNANPLPNGGWMTKQCFWFNKGYIKSIINQANKS